MAEDWNDLASFLADLGDEDRERYARHVGFALPGDAEGIVATLRAYAEENPNATPSLLLATTGVQAGAAGEMDLARRVGRAALEVAETPEDRQLARACLAQTHFRNRRDEEDLAAFVEHCEAAIELGHAGTFCYERLAVLYEYRGDLEAAARVSRRAVEVLEAAGDARSAGRFQKRLDRLAGKGAG